jgi:hypothetical protein
MLPPRGTWQWCRPRTVSSTARVRAPGWYCPGRVASGQTPRVGGDQYLAGGRPGLGAGRARPFLTGMVGLTRYAADGDNEIRFAVSDGGGGHLALSAVSAYGSRAASSRRSWTPIRTAPSAAAEGAWSAFTSTWPGRSSSPRVWSQCSECRSAPALHLNTSVGRFHVAWAVASNLGDNGGNRRRFHAVVERAPTDLGCAARPRVAVN